MATQDQVCTSNWLQKILKTRLSDDLTSKINLERDSVAAQEGMRETDVEMGNLEEPPSIPTTH
jgi:hypothetical protein